MTSRVRRLTALAGAAVALPSLLVTTPANAALGPTNGVGPTGAATAGFPAWYQAAGVRVEPCVDDPSCPPGTGFDDEFFYAFARMKIDVGDRGRIVFKAVLEGAIGPDPVTGLDGPLTFARVQVTGSKLVPNKKLTLTGPYIGNVVLNVDGRGKVTRVRNESVQGSSANGFRAPLTETQSGYGPKFLYSLATGRNSASGVAGRLGDVTAVGPAAFTGTTQAVTLQLKDPTKPVDEQLLNKDHDQDWEIAGLLAPGSGLVR